jgi:hypothetical protein
MNRKRRGKRQEANMRFYFVFQNSDGEDIEPVQAIEANSIGHALQKIAAALPDTEVFEIQVWKGGGDSACCCANRPRLTLVVDHEQDGASAQPLLKSEVLV